MKKGLKRTVSLFLVLCLVWLMLPTKALAEMPIEKELSEGVTWRDNRDGTATIRVRAQPSPANEAEPVLGFCEDGDSYVNAAEGEETDVEVALAKAFSPASTLATVCKEENSISFYPEAASTETAEKEPALSAPTALAKIATETDCRVSLLRVGAAAKAEAEAEAESGLETEAETEAKPELEPEAKAGPEAETEEESTAEQVVVAIAQEAQGDTYGSLLYSGIMDETTDLLFEPLENGLKESIILREYTAAPYRFVLETELRPELNGQQILLKDEAGEAVAEIPAPYMFDVTGAISEKIAVSLEALGGRSYRLIYAPDTVWLQSAQYPVTVDPSVVYLNYDTENYNHISDNMVCNSAGDKCYQYDANYLYSGYCDDGEAIAYILPVLDDVEDVIGDALLLDMTLETYVDAVAGSSTYSLRQVYGPWNSRSITWNNSPAYGGIVETKDLSGGRWYSWDLTPIASHWFNALDQDVAAGVCITADSPYSGWAKIASSDCYAQYAMCFSITYCYELNDTKVSATPHGNAANSGTGYVDLSWSSVSRADGYYVGISRGGSDYTYTDVGYATSWTSGALPCIPDTTGGSLYYHFVVVPHNAYGQAPNPGHFSKGSVKLPDRLPPNKASSVTLTPKAGAADTLTLTWAGITDYNMIDTGAVTNLGTGHVQYAWDSTEAAAWRNLPSNQGSGSADVDTSALADGQHYLYLRGMDAEGNTGTAVYASAYIDRLPPTAPTVTVTPADWTAQDSVSLSWSGITDAGELQRVEYAIDGGAYVSTGKTDKSFSGYALPMTDLSSGEHIVSLRGVDAAGNVGQAGTVTVKRDTQSPTVISCALVPDTWSDALAFTYTWEGLADGHSGLGKVTYTVDDGAEAIATDTEIVIPSSALTEGQHSLKVTFADRLGNSLQKSAVMKKDTEAPTVHIDSPREGDMVNGTAAVYGHVEDVALASWRLTVTGKDGVEKELRSDTKARTGLLGTVNTRDYEDAETLTFRLYAEDLAGHHSVSTNTAIIVNKSAVPVPGSVSITAPRNHAVLTAASVDGSYTREGSESRAYLYVDGKYAASAADGKFTFHPVCYGENTTHSISILSEDSDGTMRYSAGMQDILAFSDDFSDTTQIAEAVGVEVDNAVSGTGTLLSQPIPIDGSTVAVRLTAAERASGEAEILYFCSTDSGATWQPIAPERDIPILDNSGSVQLKATLRSSGSHSAALLGWDLHCIVESAPMRVTTKLLREIHTFPLPTQSIYAAQVDLGEACPADCQTAYQYVARQYAEDGFTFHALNYEDGSTQEVALLGLDADGALYATDGATVSVLLRENVESAVSVTRTLSSAQPIYALRLLAADRGTVTYRYTTDGESWAPLPPGGCVILKTPAAQVDVRAEVSPGSQLYGWHLEAVSVPDKALTVDLRPAVMNATGSDYGKYSDKRYELRWTDNSRQDSTAENGNTYEIYRNGECLATTSDLQYVDRDYVEGAAYQIRPLRSYTQEGKYPVRFGESADVSITVISRSHSAPEVTPEEGKQSDSLTRLYEENTTFSDDPHAPTGDKALNDALLGKGNTCVYGFEPINFNTGNFYLNTTDYALSDLGESGFSLDRSYNSQHNGRDGAFGVGWSSVYSQHLIQYQNGDITFCRADGCELQFYVQPDGSYRGSGSLTLRAAGNGYELKDTDGTTTAFSSIGLLRSITGADGNTTTVEHDAKGVLSAVKLPSGKAIRFSADKNGHITKFSTAEGQEHTYTYRGNYLTAHTAPDGAVTRYEYDARGRMTAWYDALGNRQVKNTYDGQNRVIRQIDALGGVFTLEYHDDYTAATDAMGHRTETWFDAKKRTTKTVDAMGGTVRYEYDARDNITAITNEIGETTRYEYDEEGRLAAATAPNGETTRYQYDESGNYLGQIGPDGTFTGVAPEAPDTNTYEYDAIGRVISKTDENGDVTTYTYDAVGNVTSVTDKNGTVTYEYDHSYRPISRTDARGTTRYEYDACGNIISVTDSQGNVVYYQYDAARNAIQPKQSGFLYLLARLLKWQAERWQYVFGILLPVQVAYASTNPRATLSGRNNKTTTTTVKSGSATTTTTTKTTVTGTIKTVTRSTPVSTTTTTTKTSGSKTTTTTSSTHGGTTFTSTTTTRTTIFGATKTKTTATATTPAGSSTTTTKTKTTASGATKTTSTTTTTTASDSSTSKTTTKTTSKTTAAGATKTTSKTTATTTSKSSTSITTTKTTTETTAAGVTTSTTKRTDTTTSGGTTTSTTTESKTVNGQTSTKTTTSFTPAVAAPKGTPTGRCGVNTDTEEHDVRRYVEIDGAAMKQELVDIPLIGGWMDEHVDPNDITQIWFALNYPVAALQIGQDHEDGTNISSNARHFAANIGLVDVAGRSEGTPINAMRHTIWVATIANRFGEEVSRYAANAHETDPYVLDKVPDPYNTFFAGTKEGLQEADIVIDLLNNEIAREINKTLPKSSSMTEIARAALDYYHENGLHVAEENEDGTWRIALQKLDDASYNKSVAALATLDENGFRPTDKKYSGN